MAESARTRAVVAALALVTAGCLAGCAAGERPGAGGRPLVAVSLPPLAWMVERLAGDRVAVEVVLPPATAPEGWSPTPTAMLAVAGADLYFGVGHPAIAFEKRLMAQTASGGGETLTLLRAASSEAAAVPDPHLWLDPDLVASIVPKLVGALQALDPDGAASFAGNGERLVDEIGALDGRIEALFARPTRSFVVVQHAAWVRLLDRYGLSEEAIEQEGKEAEPGRMVELVEISREADVATVFTQRGLSDRSARLLATELDAEIVPLDPLARDWPHNLEEAAERLAAAVH